MVEMAADQCRGVLGSEEIKAGWKKKVQIC